MNTPKKEPELLRCPFCGGDSSVIPAVPDTRLSGPWFRPVCNSCHMSSAARYATEEKAAEAWNKRTNTADPDLNVLLNWTWDLAQPGAGGHDLGMAWLEACQKVISRLTGKLVEPVQSIAGAPDYSGMSREALERHCVRLAQVLDGDKAYAFWNKYAFAPKLAPSCVCCGELPKTVAVQHVELPGIVVCGKCRDAAVAAATPSSKIIGWLRDQRGSFEGPETLDPLFVLGSIPYDGRHGATYTPVIPYTTQTDEFERGREQGMRQERALWELAREGQEIEKPVPPTGKVTPKNRYTHDSEGHAYTFSVSPKGELQCNGLEAETWLRMALTHVQRLIRGEETRATLNAAASYIDKGIACVGNRLTATTVPSVAEANALKREFERECNDSDQLLRLMGLKPSDYRTDGGAINIPRVRWALTK